MWRPTGCVAAFCPYATAANNRTTSDGTYNYEYDAEGNRTRRVNISDNTSTEYVWDHRNRLTRVSEKNAAGTVTKQTDYVYDVFDRRIGNIVDADGAGAGVAAATRLAYDGQDIVLAYAGTGSLANRYLYGPAVDQILADEKLSAGLWWDLPDHQGTVRDVVNNSTFNLDHIRYGAYGNIVAETGPGNDHPFGYTGRDRDRETGLYYYRSRYYDPVAGRFLSEDTIGFDAGDANLYRYVGNHPVNATDPSGTEEYGDVLSGRFNEEFDDHELQRWVNRGKARWVKRSDDLWAAVVTLKSDEGIRKVVLVQQEGFLGWDLDTYGIASSEVVQESTRSDKGLANHAVAEGDVLIAVVIGFDQGLETGQKAVVNGVAQAVVSTATLGFAGDDVMLIEVTQEDLDRGYATAVVFSRGSGELLVAAATGGASRLSQGTKFARLGTVANAWDTAGKALNVARGGADVVQRGELTLQNGAMILTGSLVLLRTVTAIHSE